MAITSQQFKDFLSKIDKATNLQKRFRCSISNKNYYKKVYFSQIGTSINSVETERLLSWTVGRDLHTIYLIFSYCGIGSNVYVVDEVKKEWKEITDFDSW